MENKLRFDITKSFLGLKWTTGANIQTVEYDNYTYQVLKSFISLNATQTIASPLKYNYFTDLAFKKYGAFFQLGKRAFNNRLGISAGIRTDGNGFNNSGKDFMSRISPRLGFSYVLTDKINLNASIGRYFKVAPLTVLGFKDLNGNFVNKNADYIGSNHYVMGIEYIPSDATRFTAEVFAKNILVCPLVFKKELVYLI